MTEINEKLRGREDCKHPPLWMALAIIIFFAVCFIAQLILYGEPDAHMTIIFAAVFAVILLWFNGTPFKLVEEGIIHGVKLSIVSMMVVMFMGIMIPAWIAAGTVVTMVYYGLQIISPSVFLFTTIIICVLTGLVIGTSWGTAATFGVALMGIGHGLGIPPEWTAGAVISGSMFGNHVSPMADTTNLSSGVCEVNLFKHIRGVLPIAIPGLIVSLVVALVMGLRFRKNNFDPNQVEALLSSIRANFNVTPVYALISLIPLVLVIIMALRKTSALATMVSSAISAMIVALLIRGYNIQEMMSFMHYGFVLKSGNENLDIILNRGGLLPMMWTLSLGLLGLSFGGILEKTGVLDTLLLNVSTFTKSAKNLIITHTIVGIGTVMLTSSPMVSILIPGRMFIKGYDKLGISRYVASRTCSVSGVSIDPITPWTLSGVYYSGILGVSTMSYAMYTVYAWVVPMIAIIYTVFGLFIPKTTSDQIKKRETELQTKMIGGEPKEDKTV